MTQGKGDRVGAAASTNLVIEVDEMPLDGDTAMPQSLAISLLVEPAAICRKICTSRSVVRWVAQHCRRTVSRWC